MEYANIIVNISHENLDKTFQYKIPSSMQGILEVGDYVSVPFGKGNKIINGYVLELTDSPVYDPDKIKEIEEINTDNRLVEYKLIKLAYWMKKRYGSTMINALKTVLPVKRKVREKEEKSIILKIGEKEAYERLSIYLKKHQTARERLLRELINEGELDYKVVTGKLNVSAATIKAMEQQEVLSIKSRRVYRNTVIGNKPELKLRLNEDQKYIVDSITDEYINGYRGTYLIHGITGSGKTEVYMEIISKVCEMGKSVIVLIPEISLTYQTLMRFYRRFGDKVSVLHSKLSQGEKYDQFERAKKGDMSIMIGPRSALFTPFENIGLIVIDEEHENSYKSDSMPKYHARETAIELARLHNASVILGSATPSVDAYYKALKGEYKLFTLDKRAKEESVLAKVHIVDLKQELKDGNRSMFSQKLRIMMEDRLEKGEQIMLFLNRRGYSGFVSCRSCGHVIKCPHCDVSLTRHINGKLKCHYCGYETIDRSTCPECGSTYIGTFKAGTEKVEKAVKDMFPYANVLRMDADTTVKKDSYESILSSFSNREADILIGTQMIVKGHDFPYVTLMGILIADMSLNVNDFRSGERTFQLLTQAAGRSGRAELSGEVVIQTYNPEHYAIEAAKSQDYKLFYSKEILYRSLMHYPPVGHLMAILIESPDEETLEKYTTALAETVKNDIIIDCNKKSVSIIGPTDASVKKINDIYRKMIYFKAVDIDSLILIKDKCEMFKEEHYNRKVRIIIDMDPLNGY
ncbi:MAG: primosomal protein N' [Lachnospiraceae bacterium]|nr:primosomal protein N' [Lachnospiraceae bacterium]